MGIHGALTEIAGRKSTWGHSGREPDSDRWDPSPYPLEEVADSDPGPDPKKTDPQDRFGQSAKKNADAQANLGQTDSELVLVENCLAICE